MATLPGPQRQDELLRSTQQELETQIQDLRRLHEMCWRISSTLELEPMLNVVLDAALDVHGATAGLLSLRDVARGGLQIGASRGLNRETQQLVAFLSAGSPLWDHCVMGRRRYSVEDIEEDPEGREWRELRAAARVRSLHATPLITCSGNVVGVISVHFDRSHRSTERQTQLVELYARHAADTIEAAQLRDRTRVEIVERIRAEQALVQSEERFRLAVQNDGLRLYEQDQNLRYVWLHPWPDGDQGIGQTDLELLPESEARPLYDIKSRVMATGVPERVEIKVTLKGVLHYYDLFVSPRRNGRGEAIGVAGAALDITSRIQAEEASRRLAAIVESSEDAIYSEDLNGVIRSWNEGARRMFGFLAEEVIGRSSTCLVPPELRAEQLDLKERIQVGERVRQFETERRCRDESRVHVALSLSPLRDAAGVVTGASTIARDITQRKRSDFQQQALYDLVARVNRAEALPDIYEAALDSICRCHDTHRASILLYAPDGVMRFVAWRGLSPEYRRAVEGHSPWARDDPAPEPVCLNDLAEAPLPENLRSVIDREGIRSLAFIPLCFEKRLLGKFMIYRDAAHRYSSEEVRLARTIASQVAFAIERQRGEESLEGLVAERTASLREAVAQMEEFSYSVSHDLRTPVRAMKGYAHALIEDYGATLSEEARNYVSRILTSTERMDRLIQDVLCLSRIDREELLLKPVALTGLVDDILHQYPEFQPPRSRIEVSGTLDSVMAHEPSLLQVVSNLLSNAVKFVRPGQQPHVRLWTERSDGRVRLFVKDNGIGIHRQHQARIFGMFERIHSEKDYDGTGIGLAIVRKAIERMEGTVGLESDGQTGSTFWVELPAA